MKWRKSGIRTAPSCWVRSQGVMKGRFAGSCSTEITNSRSESMVGRRRRGSGAPDAVTGPSRIELMAADASDVDLDRVAVQFHQVAARLRLALAHQAGQR